MHRYHKYTRLCKQAAVAALCSAMPFSASLGAGVVTGPTPIDQGMAVHNDDFTIYNDKIAASFAVGTPNYWNMTSGSILDVALMNQGKFGTDLVNDVEFLNDFWTATGAFEGKDLLHVSPDQVTYRLEKDAVIVTAHTQYWTAGHKKPLNVDIEYTLKDGDNYISLKTTVTNPADNDPYRNMNSGYSISTLAASMFGPFGYYPDVKTTGIHIGADPDVNEPYGNFVVTYGKNYAVSVSLDGANAYKGSSGYKDVYINRDIEPGKSYIYTGELLVSGRGETASIMTRYLQKHPSVPAGSVEGVVRDSQGQPVANAYVVVRKNGSYKQTVRSHGADAVMKDIMQPLVWTITDDKGHYALHLPQGAYELYAQSQGTTPSAVQPVQVKGDMALDFALQEGAKASFTAVDGTGSPIPFKVAVQGIASDVKTLGGTVFFADPQKDAVSFSLAAPKTPVTFTAYHGADFTSLPASFTTTLRSGEQLSHQFVIPQLIYPEKQGWYGNDNHQHSNIGDGATPIGELYKAQVAAGLDFNLVADHDSTVNSKAMADLAAQGHRPYIANIEVSPGWGHWGILNNDYTLPPIDPSLPPAEIIRQAHQRGGLVVVHHPYSDYGYLNNRAGVKGGYDQGSDDFDFLELQSTMNLADADNIDKKALDAAMSYWDKGEKKYLSAGSDQHDVTSGLYPGIIRLYAHIDGKATAPAYLQAMKDGHAYATMGPIFTPAPSSLFGTTQTIQKGSSYTLKTQVQAVNGIKKIEVRTKGGVVVDTRTLDGTTKPVEYELTVTPTDDTWYNIVAVDGKDHYAVTNPVWIQVQQ